MLFLANIFILESLDLDPIGKTHIFSDSTTFRYMKKNKYPKFKYESAESFPNLSPLIKSAPIRQLLNWKLFFTVFRHKCYFFAILGGIWFKVHSVFWICKKTLLFLLNLCEVCESLKYSRQTFKNWRTFRIQFFSTNFSVT